MRERNIGGQEVGQDATTAISKWELTEIELEYGRRWKGEEGLKRGFQ